MGGIFIDVDKVKVSHNKKRNQKMNFHGLPEIFGEKCLKF